MNILNLSGKTRLRALSGELESAIMEILWTKGPMKGKDLYIEIRREKEIAYTTALTVLGRLSKKGFVKKDRNSGMITFSPDISRKLYKNTVAESLVQRAFELSPDLAVSAFADMLSKMPEGNLAKLEKLLEEKKNGAHQD